MFPAKHRRLAGFEVTEEGDLFCNCAENSEWRPAPVGMVVAMMLPFSFARPLTGTPVTSFVLAKYFQWFMGFVCEHTYELDGFACGDLGKNIKPGSRPHRCKYCGAERALWQNDELIDDDDPDQPEHEYMVPDGFVRHDQSCPFHIWGEMLSLLGDVAQAYLDSHPAADRAAREALYKLYEKRAQEHKGEHDEQSKE